MHFSTTSIVGAALLSTSVSALAVDRTLAHPARIFRRQDEGTCLNQDAIQVASSLSGQEEGTEGIKAGQAASQTDNGNFINFCSGKTLTDGRQNAAGSCNGVPMGEIPALENMISAMIISPAHNEQIPANTPIQFTVQTRGLSAGIFTNPTTTYYAAPQTLDDGGSILGHCHFTVQDIGAFDSNTPPDPITFAFFKGVDDAGNNQGLLTATDDDGLPPGFYRVCTMISGGNHQPVLMPVAQRGAQDDCVRFQVVGNDDSQNEDGGDANDSSAEEGAENGGDADMGEIISATGDAVPAPTDPVSATGDAPEPTATDAEGAEEDAENPDAPEVTGAPDAPEGDADAPEEEADAGEDGAEGEENAEEAPEENPEEPAEDAPEDAPEEEAGAEEPATPTLPNTPPVPEVTSGDLGGEVPPVEWSGNPERPFSVLGQLFSRFEAFAAVQRACQTQFNTCADQANRGELEGGRRGVGDCVRQRVRCGIAR